MRKRLDLCGWVLFVGGLVIWLTQAVMVGDILGMVTGAMWFTGCSLFILTQLIKSDSALSSTGLGS